MKILKKTLAVAFVLLYSMAGNGLYAQKAQPTTPQTLSYQGILKTTEGNLSSGSRLLTVTLYADANGNTTIWQSTMNTPVDANGVFNCMLGTTDNPLPNASAMDRPIWLGIAVDGSAELRPLSQITSSVYAINVADSAITSSKISAGAVTADKLNMDYISSISVNGQRVTAQGTDLNIIAGDGVNLTYDDASKSILLNTSGPATNTGGKGAKAETANGTVYWGETGNYGLTTPDNFLGTTENTILWFKVNGNTTPGSYVGTVMRYVPITSGEPNIIGGNEANSITTANGSVIAGGGTSSSPNAIEAEFSSIGGGEANTIASLSTLAFIGGGDGNIIDTNCSKSFIGGGNGNHILVGTYPAASGEEAYFSSIVGGNGNTIYSDGQFIGGGESNLAAGEDVSVVGGFSNKVVNSSASVITGGGQNGIGVNETEGYSDYSFVGAGNLNNIYASVSAIDAGKSNRIDSLADASIIGSGNNNFIQSLMTSSVIAGGDLNKILFSADFTYYNSDIGGGSQNTILSSLSDIDGGILNRIDNQAHYSSIGGGQLNHIDTFSAHSIIGDGGNNYIASTYCVIGGGMQDSVRSTQSSVVGGSGNAIDAISDLSIIGGGGSNKIYGSTYSVIGGGASDTIKASADGSVIGGGRQNKIDTFSLYSFIGGGDSNHIARSTLWHKNNHQAYWATIAGGQHNEALDVAAFVGGGQFNIAGEEDAAVVSGLQDTVLSSQSTIAGGYNNRIGFNEIDKLGDTGSQQSFIGSGLSNGIDAGHSGIVGGQSNRIDSFANLSFIGGGLSDTIDIGSPNSTIGGGSDNHIKGSLIVDPPGIGPTFDTFAGPYNTIAGGDTNTILGAYSAIGGGLHNKIATGIPCAAIPGGDSLTANSFAQTVIGYNNIVSGTFFEGTTHNFTSVGPQDQPLLIIGNGDNPGSKSNAFEISYDGHSRVTDLVGVATNNRPATIGATYQDNIVYAWGDITGFNDVLPCTGHVLVTSSFGIKAAVTYVCVGEYIVTLNTTDVGGAFTNWAGLSIVATPAPTRDTRCVIATVQKSPGGVPNAFEIFLDNLVCDSVDTEVMFQVTGRHVNP